MKTGNDGAAHTRIVHHDGNRYLATAEMAGIFLTKTAGITARGDTQLVPLLHSLGVDLLLISPSTVFAVTVIEVGRAA